MIDIDPSWLKIPHTIARRYAKPDTDFYEELVSVGNLELVRSASVYDPEVTGYDDKPCRPEWFIFGNVKRFVRTRVFTRGGRYDMLWRTMLSLDYEITGPSGTTLGERLEAKPLFDAERADYVTNLLGRLPAKWKAVVELKMTGHKNADIARELGCTRQNVSGMWVCARKRLKKLMRRMRLEENLDAT